MIALAVNQVQSDAICERLGDGGDRRAFFQRGEQGR